MDVIHRCCGGLDVHARTVVACLIKDGRKQTRTFSTMTDELLLLSDWLSGEGCTHAAIESTGVYWKPVFNLLEGVLEVVLVNARHVKAVPGRKTDVRDCEWLADLLRHGLLKASFIPPLEIRELRELTRYRQTLVREQASVANRVQRIIESGNIKLGQVASDVLGVSGRLMLRALCEGETDGVKLAALARGQLKKKEYGAWVMPMFRILASLKKLRGTRLDIFGYSEERRMERRLIGEYQATIEQVLDSLGQDNHALAVQIAAVPDSMRGFGHIKEKNVKAAKEREASLLAAYRNPATQSVAAE